MSPSACKTAELIAGYTIKEQIGAGGYGEVWKADAPGGLSKAIKFVYGHLDGERAACELKALNRIKEVRHPFLLSLERIEVVDGQLIIITELADASLKDRYQECQESGLPGIPRDELLIYLHDAAEALDYMSGNFSLQHLDIKPENLLIVSGHVKVADFGLVKDVRSATASLMGGLTLVYAAAEVFDGRPSLCSDQYSLAIVYQEMLTGVLPFPGRTPAQLAAQHLHSKPQLAPLPESDRATIARALLKDPEQRFPSCREMIERLLESRSPATGTRVPDQASQAAPAPETKTLSEPLPNKPSASDTQTMVLGRESRGVETPMTGPPDEPLAAPSLPEMTGEIKTLPPLEVTPEEIGLRPTLVVGIGGTGARTLARLHRRLHDRFENLSEVPALQMLLIDTDAHDVAQVTSSEGGIGLDADQTLVMKLRQRQDYRDDSDAFLRWLSRRWLYNIPRSLRTEGLRPLGRLALVDHTEQLFDRLRTAVAAMTDPAKLAASAEETGMAVRNKAPRVFIVASLSGGTGGGTVLDVAYAVRIVLADAGLPHEGMCGILTHSTGRRPEAKDLANANAYVSLSELHHFTRVGRYPGNPAARLPTFDENVGPFDDAYLIHLGDNLDASEFEAASDVLAEYLYLNVATAGGALFDKCREALGTSADSRRPQPTLRTFGLSQIGCSQTAIPAKAVSLLCQQVVRRWCGEAESTGPRPTFGLDAHYVAPKSSDSSGPSETDQTKSAEPEGAEDLQLNLDSLIRQIREGMQRKIGDDVPKYLQSCLDHGVADQEGEGSDAPANSPADNLFATVDALLGKQGKGNELPAVPEGSLQRPLATNLKVIASQRGGALHDWILRLADTSAERLKGSQRAAEWATQRSQSLIVEAAERLTSVRAELAELERAIREPGDGERPRRKGWLGIGRAKKQTQEFNHRWAEYFELRCTHLALQAVARLLNSLQGQAARVGDQLKTFRRELRLLMDRVATDSAEKDADPPDDDQTSADPLEALRSSVAETLHDSIPDLAAQLDRQFEESFFAEHGGLRGVLEKNVELQGPFVETLLNTARAAILKTLNTIDVAEPLLAPEWERDESKQPLRALLKAAKPALLGCDASQRLVLVCPESANDELVLQELQRHVDETPSVIHDSDGDLIVCYEAEQLSMAAAAAGLIGHRRDYAEVASRLHTRIDVTWSPLPKVE